MLSILIAVIACLLSYYYYAIKKPKTWNNLNELPGPSSLPIIGSMHNMRRPKYHYFMELSKYYGPAFAFFFGHRKAVIINDYGMVKRLMKLDALSGRPQLALIRIVDKDCGVIDTDSIHWSEHRSFILRVFRDFGFGKSRSESIVEDECDYLVEKLNELCESSINFNGVIPEFTANVISKFTMNRRLVSDDPLLVNAKVVMDVTSKAKDYLMLFDAMFPSLKNSWIFEKFVLWFTDRNELFNRFYRLLEKEIEDHREKLKSKTDPEDYIDRYLQYQDSLENSKDSKSQLFSTWDLVINSAHLFLAGYDTTSTSLGWSIFFAAYNSDIQQKLYDEIVSVVGFERKVKMSDRKHLNYVAAFLDESFRLSSIVPLALTHRSLENIPIDDKYYIPADTLVIYNSYAVHRDPKVWKNPETFNPDRFLDENGIYKSNESLIVFGTGKRQCLGESLARMEYFIFFSNIISKFKIELAKAVSNDEYNDIMKANDGVIRFCKYSNYKFVKR